MARWSDRMGVRQSLIRSRDRLFVAWVLTALYAAAILFLPRPAIAQGLQPQQALQPPSLSAGTMADDAHATLGRFGTFVQHQKYGEVWVPSVTPPGWHPYPPCGWVKTRRYGWFYDDKTPWGQIVHHYGRWLFTQEMGWIWVPGAEFSPGWVVWRTSPQYVGWAPMLPEQDVQVVSADAFNGPDQWLFMETARFASGCDGSKVQPSSQVATLIEQTTYATRLEYVDGIAVFVLPTYVVGPFFDVAVTFDPYPVEFFTQLVVDFNFIFHHFKPKVQTLTVCTFSEPN